MEPNPYQSPQHAERKRSRFLLIAMLAGSVFIIFVVVAPIIYSAFFRVYCLLPKD
jgi:hypothetical protein